MSDQVPQQRDTKFDFSGSGIVGGFIKSINGDTTPAQLLTVAAGDPQVQINNVANDHQFRLTTFIPATGSPGPPVVFTTVPPGLPATVLGTLTIFNLGWYTPFAYVESSAATPLPGTTISKLTLLVNGLYYESMNFEDSTSANITDYAHSVAFNPRAFNPADVISLLMNHDAVAGFDVAWRLAALRSGGV